MITSVDCTIVRFNISKIIPEYFVYLTTTDNYYENLAQYLTGASRQRISRKNLEQVQIPLPPMNVQRKIVDKVNSYLHLINQKQQEIAELEQNIQDSVNPIWK